MSAYYYSLGMLIAMSHIDAVEKVVLIHGLAREENQ